MEFQLPSRWAFLQISRNCRHGADKVTCAGMKPCMMVIALLSTLCCVDAAEMSPVASWNFDLIGEGPRPPEFPRFTPTNKAARFDGAGSKIVIPDEGAESRFDFTNGNAITIEGPDTRTRIRQGKSKLGAAIGDERRASAAEFSLCRRTGAGRRSLGALDVEAVVRHETGLAPRRDHLRVW